MKGLGEASEKLSTPDPVDWIEKNFYIPETRDDPILRGKIQLVDYQRDALREALSKDENGLFKYDVIVWSDIKKSIKSTIAAAVNLFRACTTDWAEMYIVANDLKQADSRVAYYLRRALQLNPKIGKQFSIRGYRMTHMLNGSFLEALPIDPTGEAGTNPDSVTFSELWGNVEDAQRRMWVEMAIPPAKHGKAYRWVETYAGFLEESELLYSLYEMGVKEGKLLWPDRLYPVTGGEPAPLELYVNKEARFFCLWNTQPRCPWQIPEYYASEERLYPPAEFRRIHRNQWVSNIETFIPIEWWDACRRTESDWPGVDKKRHNFIIALDAASTNDNFAMFMGCRHPEFPDEVLTLYARKWKPVNGKIDFEGTPENPGPWLELLRLLKEYNVIMITYDPNQLHDMSMRLKHMGVTWVKEFGQGEPRLKADSQFRDLIRDRRFWHRGEPDLREHIQNSNAQIDSNDSKIRIVKRVEKLKIDLAVAASMCSYQLLRLNLA